MLCKAAAVDESSVGPRPDTVRRHIPRVQRWTHVAPQEFCRPDELPLDDCNPAPFRGLHLRGLRASYKRL